MGEHELLFQPCSWPKRAQQGLFLQQWLKPLSEKMKKKITSVYVLEISLCYFHSDQQLEIIQKAHALLLKKH